MKISEQTQLFLSKIKPDTGQKAPAGKSPDKLPFAPGQLIKATVAAFTGDGKVLLDIGGQTISAQTMVPLTPGSELWLEAETSGASPLLTLAAKKGAVQDFLKLLITGTQTASSNTKGLSDLLAALLPELTSQTTLSSQVLAGSAIAATSGEQSWPAAVKMLTLMLGSSAGTQQDIAQLLDSLAPPETMLRPALEASLEKLAKILGGTRKEISQFLNNSAPKEAQTGIAQGPAPEPTAGKMVEILARSQQAITPLSDKSDQQASVARLAPGLEPALEKLVTILAGSQKEMSQLLQMLGPKAAMPAPGLEGGMEKLVTILTGTQKEISQLLQSFEQVAAQPGLAPEPGIEKLVKVLAATQKEIVQVLEEVDQKAALLKPGLEPSTEKLVKILAAHQQINSHPPQTNEQNFLLFPCFFAGNAGWGEWIFSMEKQEGQDRGEQYNLSFFLEMSNLGPLALQATIADRTINGQILLSTEKARAHVADNVGELAQILGRQGYQPVYFTCRVNKENMLSQLKETLQEKAAIQRFSLLDVSV